jgi:GNAT superfamily N-acetyltransferase
MTLGQCIDTPDRPAVNFSDHTVSLPAVYIAEFGLDEITDDVLAQLEPLYSLAYERSRMYARLVEDLAERPKVFRLFVARTRDETHRIVGARVVESKPHPLFEYHGFAPVHGKRFCVDPKFRGRGVGRRLIASCNRLAFTDLQLPALFGESKELGALSMHGREGARYSLDSIRTYSARNSHAENVAFFATLLEDPRFRSYRLPSERSIHFAYCRSPDAIALLERHEYVSRTALLDHALTHEATDAHQHHRLASPCTITRNYRR